MPSDRDAAKRKEIADKFLTGSGFEIGAGLTPSIFEGLQSLIFIDKRDKSELAELHGSPIPYTVMRLEEARRIYSGGADFVIAHHVIEHCANPVRMVQEWGSLIADKGLFFISLPSEKNACEVDRRPTPIEHILDDYVFNRESDNYDTQQHIPSFLNQWTAQWPETFSFAKHGVAQFAKQSLVEMSKPDINAHYHTFTLEVAAQTIEAAFYFAKFGLRWLHQEETVPEALYLVGQRLPTQGAKPRFIEQYMERLSDALGQLGD